MSSFFLAHFQYPGLRLGLLVHHAGFDERLVEWRLRDPINKSLLAQPVRSFDPLFRLALRFLSLFRAIGFVSYCGESAVSLGTMNLNDRTNLPMSSLAVPPEQSTTHPL